MAGKGGGINLSSISTNDGRSGATNLNTYNNPQNGGDATDWASTGATNAVINDAYDAFGTPGVVTHVSSIDLLEDAALGYSLTANGVAEIAASAGIPA